MASRGYDGEVRTLPLPPITPGGWAVLGLGLLASGLLVALRDVSLTIAPGEKVALVGPNGAGKSTLLLHLNGILRPATGSVHVSSLAVQDKNLGRVRAAVGLVFQDPDDQLFSPTVFDDVAFGPLYQGLPETEVRTRVHAALTAIHMGDYAPRISHHLSMGEKKRIAIATVLAMNPEILVLDEPTAGLDPRARRGLINLLRELPQTMLVSTHDIRMVAELLPRTVVMDQGAVVADGLTAAILADAILLEAHGLEM
ncbi:MAG: cobalt ABC transporter ATP-binding protein [Chloroflexi bacterium HGW-Chloroflexi-1]|nr:MAG: cobalt ABC transporter ATP-binding protein [Chloroflexi bacterium HGW-Chloroflexi-1]